MAYSIYTAYGDGVTNQFTISFGLGYIDKADVKCRVNKEVDGLGQPSYRPLTWITDSLVQVGGTVPADGYIVEFIRTVSKTSLVHDYSDGVEIQEKNLDDSNKQTLMAVQEVLDGRFEVGLATDLDFANHKAINLAAGTDPNDAVNLTQLQDMTGNAPAHAAAAAVSAASSAASAAAAAISEANAAAQAALLPLNNYSAVIDPTVNDDSGDGYSAGSQWVNTTTGDRFSCSNAAVGAAVWTEISADLSALGSAAYADTTDFATPAQGALADTAVQPADQTMRLLQTYTLNNVPSVDITSVLSSTYDSYIIELTDIRVSVDNVALNMVTSSDNGVSWDTNAASYRWVTAYDGDASATTANVGSPSAPLMQLLTSVSNNYDEDMAGTIRLFGANTAKHKKFIWDLNFMTAGAGLGPGTSYIACGAGRRLSTAVVNAVRISPSSGNIVSGTVRVYGIKK